MCWEDFVRYFSAIEALCENIGVDKGYKKDCKNKTANKVKREVNKFIKIPRNEFKNQMQE